MNKKKYAYTTGELGSVVQTIPYVYDTTWRDKLISYDGKAITYDAIGNPLTYDGWTYEWQAGRQLKRMYTNEKEVAFEYDAKGLRTRKIVTEGTKVTTTEYTLHGKLLMHQTVTTVENNGAPVVDAMHFYYDAQSRPEKLKLNNNIYTYSHDLQGDIAGILDNTGCLVVEYKYDAWGKSTDDPSSLTSEYRKLYDLNPFRYKGYVRDGESGLYYLRSRFYNSDWGRFINTDSYIGQVAKLNSHNVYAYCHNVPVLLVDGNGHSSSSVEEFCQRIIGEIISAYVHGLVSMVMQSDHYMRDGGKLVSFQIKKKNIKAPDAKSRNNTISNTVKWISSLTGAAIGCYTKNPLDGLKGWKGTILGWIAGDMEQEITDFIVDSYSVMPGEYISIYTQFQYGHKHMFFIDCDNDYVEYEIRLYGQGYIEVWKATYMCGYSSVGLQKVGAATREELGF